MEIVVNGECRDCEDGISISGLFDSLGIDKRYVAVELNRQIIPRTLLSEKKLKEHDSIEIVTFVGGG